MRILLMHNVFSIPFADTNLQEDEKTIENKENDSITILKNYLKENGKDVAAFMAEPLVLGAGGMRMCRASYLNKIVKLLKKKKTIKIKFLKSFPEKDNFEEIVNEIVAKSKSKLVSKVGYVIVLSKR